MNRHTWLASVLPSKAALLRAPFLTHVVLEDWLLEQRPA
jgi:[acyl-carrier-protein] S-malonyltransferase